MLHAATIVGVYGIKGWVKLRSFTDPIENVLAFSRWYLRPGRRLVHPAPRPGATVPGSQGQGSAAVQNAGRRSGAEAGSQFRAVTIAEGRRHGKGLVARLDGIADRDSAEQLRGQELWVPADDLPALDEGEYYWHELEGLEVWTRHEGQSVLLGVVSHMMETGANDVMVLAPGEACADRRERLIPYLPGSVVERVDLAAGRIDVTWHPED
jgi:16S rRNA processing protein RimM